MITREISVSPQHGMSVVMHAPDGFDEMGAWSIGLKVKADDEPKVKAMGEAGYALAKQRFQSAMQLCDEIKGFAFTPVTAQDSEEEITAAFMQFTGLPRAIYNRWNNGVAAMYEVMNDSDLLPETRMDEQKLADPLSSPNGVNNTPKSKVISSKQPVIS